MSKPSLILTADWHIRGDAPVCRTDDYLSAQLNKIQQITHLSRKHDCAIVIAGDIGHRPFWSNKLLNTIISNLRTCNSPILVIPGQHDLPGHNLNRIWDTGLGVLIKSGTIYNLDTTLSTNVTCSDINIHTFPYGESITPPTDKTGKRVIAITHQMVVKDVPLWPGQKPLKARGLLRKFSEYDLIVSGDNHQTFVEEYKGRLLVNPGSLMRSAVDQWEHRPSVFLYYAESNAVEQVFLKIHPAEQVMSRAHVKNKESKDDRLNAFVKRLGETGYYSDGQSFRHNLESFFKKNGVPEKVKDVIREAVAECLEE
ncbi:hypothetical protein LCGC14_0957530 [marine sediment metagenome]|uniref:Calcineurin-like phosphoesterase domain-containing protein n=1 Tax=marine sediment metagenome TaxID=412755 RepID=A0A0F9NK53_9ZZZZ